MTEPIDIVIPAFNEETHLDRCLDCVFSQEYPPHLVRVWVVDAGSTDATLEIARRRAAQEPRLTVITGRGRLNAGEALNAGIEEGDAELIALVDAHTFIEPDYLALAAGVMAEVGSYLGCVGGQPNQVGETKFGKGVALARRSRFGVGGSIYSDRRERAFVDTVQGGVYRRTALKEIGGFATTMLVSEDEECNWRLRKAGYLVLLDTGLRFTYSTRSAWSAVARQHCNYGRSRVRVVRAHPDYLRPRHLAPPTFVAVTAALTLGAAFSARARVALAAVLASYGAGAAAASLAAARGQDLSLAPYVAASFTAQHLGYGVGVLGGIAESLRPGERRDVVDRR